MKNFKELTEGLTTRQSCLCAVITCLIITGLQFIIAWGVQLLWNYICPDLFGVTTITYVQALVLYLLSCILFKTNINVNK